MPGGLAPVDYDYASMHPDDFQRMANELLWMLSHRDTERYGCRSFLPAVGEGHDRGCDGYHIGRIESEEGRWNLQVKRYSRWNDVPLSEEIRKTCDLREETSGARDPDGLLLIVACHVPQDKLQDWEAKIRENGLKAAVWDKGKLDLLIGSLGPDVITGPDRVFVPIREWEPSPFLSGADDYSEALFGKQEALVQLDLFADSDTAMPTWALITGPEGSGRTHLLAKWATRRAELLLEVEDREHSNPWWPVALQQVPRRGLGAAVREELDPSGRQVIIADYPFTLEELKELSRVLLSDVDRRRMKLIVVADNYQVPEVRRIFSRWPGPVEIDLSYMQEGDFLALAESWGVREEYRYWLARFVNRNPGLLRLALTSHKPLPQLSQHSLMQDALYRRLQAMGIGGEDREAVRGVLAWLALVAPLQVPRDPDELAPPASLSPYGITPIAWRRAWNRLVDARHIIRAQLHSWEEVYVARPRLMCQAALWEIWRDFSAQQRRDMLDEANAAGNANALQAAVETCLCFGDAGEGKEMLDQLWGYWRTEFLVSDPYEQRKRLDLVGAFLPYRGRQILDLLTELPVKIADLPPVIQILPEPWRTTMSRDDLVEEAMDAASQLPLYSVNPAACLQLLDRLDQLRARRSEDRRDDPFHRAVGKVVAVRGGNTSRDRMGRSLPVLREWVRGPDPRRRAAGCFGLSQMLALSWEENYQSGSSALTISGHWFRVEPEWLVPLRTEAFTLLLDCVLRHDLEVGERANLLKGSFRHAHDNLLFAHRAEGQIPQRWDLVELLCVRFMGAIEECKQSDRDVLKAAQLIDYLGSAWNGGRLRDADSADRMEGFLIEKLSVEGTLDDHCYLCGVSVQVGPDGTLHRDRWVRPDAGERIRAMTERWWAECAGDRDALLTLVRRHLWLAREGRYDGPNLVRLLADPLIDLLDEHCEDFYDRLLVAIDPADRIELFLAAYYLSVSWARGRAIPATRPLDVLGDTPEAAELLLEAFVRSYYLEAQPPGDGLEACTRCLDFSVPSALPMRMPQAAAVLAGRSDWRLQVASLLRRAAEECQEQALFGQLCHDLGVFHQEISMEVLAQIKSYLIDRLVRVDSLDSNHLTLLAKLFCEDFSGLLSLFEQRLRYAGTLGEERGKYDPLIHDPEHIAAYLPGGAIQWRPEDVREGPRIVRDWILISQRFHMYLYGGRFFKWVDGLQPERDPESGLGRATAACLREWFEGEDPGGDGGGDGKDVGVKYWGIPILLKWYEFDEPLLLFLMPLIEHGREPSHRDDSDWRTRIWSELIASIDTQGPEWVDGQREQRRLQMYRRLHLDTSPAAEPLIRYLLERSERNAETERLPDAELEA
jgi:hypothetical protein